MAVMHSEDKRVGAPIRDAAKPPKIYIFGGGFIGSASTSTRRVRLHY